MHVLRVLASQHASRVTGAIIAPTPAFKCLPGLAWQVGAIPGADPLVLHRVRDHVVAALAQQLRPELEEAVKANDAPAGEAYSFDAASCARRELKNKVRGLCDSRHPLRPRMVSGGASPGRGCVALAPLCTCDGGWRRKAGLPGRWARHAVARLWALMQPPSAPQLSVQALAYLAHLKEDAITEQLLSRFRSATNMTDEISALHALDIAGEPAWTAAIGACGLVWGH